MANESDEAVKAAEKWRVYEPDLCAPGSVRDCARLARAVLAMAKRLEVPDDDRSEYEELQELRARLVELEADKIQQSLRSSQEQGSLVASHEADVRCLNERIAELEAERRELLEKAAKLADRAALERGKPDNRFSDNPSAAYQAGACRAAWLIREFAAGFEHVGAAGKETGR